MSETRHHVHELIDRLPTVQLAAVAGLLKAMLDPAADPPVDEDSDTLSHTERNAIAEADEWLKHNKPIPHEEVLAELGLTVADWDKMAVEPLPEEAPRRNG